jgi:proteasomal ATPase-associated factor 1
MTSPFLLPIVTIQPTFLTVISEVDSGIIPFDTFWISCYKESQPSVHTKVHVELDETRRDVVNLEPEDTRVQIQRQPETAVSLPLDS